MLKFYLDENVDPSIATVLGRFDITATTTAEQGRFGAPDTEQLTVASALDSVLVTHDKRLLPQLAALRNTPQGHPGVIYIRQTKYSIGDIIRKLRTLANTQTVDALRNFVIFL